MAPQEIDYSDLLGLRHEPGAMDLACGALDCIGVAVEGLRRLGMPAAAAALLAVSDGEPRDGAWAPVDRAAARVGDVVLTETARGPHVGVVVSLSPTLVLSSAEAVGGYVLPLRRLAGKVQVYRAAP